MIGGVRAAIIATRGWINTTLGAGVVGHDGSMRMRARDSHALRQTGRIAAAAHGRIVTAVP